MRLFKNQLLYYTTGCNFLQLKGRLTKGNEAFQVWMIKGDTPQNAGTFLSRDGMGAVYYTLDSANDYDTVAITLEPDPMGKEPHGTMILAAKIKG
ncbi:anti-sigma factor [Paenibacillus pabuli]|uniref:anti-sigma factor n=1 Tax=Paenibacillus pabuli TaxID=1472 RepID=UPI00078195F1